MRTVIPLPPCPFVPVIGTRAVFPVRRILCIACNYATHAREMGGDPNREAPFFFAKPSDAVVIGGAPVAYPPATRNLHHEVELVLALKSGGQNLDAATAGEAVFGCAVGVDLTRRDLQAVAKQTGRPWDMAKGFDQSAPIGAILTMAKYPLPYSGIIRLTVNGMERQKGELADMIWPVPKLLAELSNFIALAPGDLVFTGTPEGIGILNRGDHVEASVTNLPPLSFTIQ